MTKKTFEPGRGYGKADWDAVDSPEITDAQIAKRTTFADAFPDLAAKRGRGRPKLASAKEAVTLRLDPGTVSRFKAGGPDWRARMAATLEKSTARG